MPTAGTIGGWVVVVAVAGSFYWVNNQRKNKNRRAVDTKQSGKAIEIKKDPKSKKRKDTGQSSGDQKTPKKSSKVQAKPTEEDVAVTTARPSADTDGTDVDNREFARAMANAKTGTITAPKSQTSNKPKSVKQSRAQDKPVVESTSAPSSTTGGDADDDQSPINSPEFSASDSTAPIASGDVSDMLEKPGDAPSVLKITAPTNPSSAKQVKPKASFEPAETKKQRQNRKKAEEKKAAREAEEKERQVLLEKQRRTAREAEGRAAKDGTAFMAAQAPSKSAWTAPPEVNGSKEAAPAKPVELLDTYEPTKGKVSTKPAEAVYSESEEAGSRLAKEYAYMTEDEQMRKVKEDSAAWETVKAKKGKKSEKSGLKDGKTSNDKQSSASEQSDFGVPPVTAPTVPGKKWGMTVVHVDNDSNVVEREMEVQDSEWEVA
ncbi:uncharacterized protein LY89DRAFT_682035 [Mollisia scopiformis]|uniref:Uncharacterized protein n=1 Tax=Mollisia scopiformis TaxID=149040 RepID=A0A194XJE5_MOLSC|nr:uncharacterized protein LY89DRAFT_682035 [Mollisia scopiformis]KUJ20278.1 hypothetical protein LY89DRAFT_682035 [Mollisia scopiformis]